MGSTPVYWRGWREAQLAAFQQDQGSSNHCAKYAAATALNLLCGRKIDGKDLVDWVDTRPLRGTGIHTIWGNHNGSLVFQTANLLRALADLEGISLRLRTRRVDTAALQSALHDGETLALVSLTYLQGKEPRIALGQSPVSSLAPARLVGGHIMIPAAYDPSHHDSQDVETSWGFLSSWGAKDHLYWMTAGEFNRTWGRLSIFNTVTVSVR